MGAKGAEKLVAAIAASKTRPLERLVFALGFVTVGEHVGAPCWRTLLGQSMRFAMRKRRTWSRCTASVTRWRLAVVEHFPRTVQRASSNV